MNVRAREALWRQLAAAGLAQGDLPPASPAASPWYVRLMLGICGWIAAGFLIGALGASVVVIFQNDAVTLAIGLVAGASACLIFRSAGSGEFAPQFGLAISLAGQVLVIAGLFGLLQERFDPVFFLAVAVFEVTLVAVIANFTHRVWSTLAATIAVSLAIADLGAGSVEGLAGGLIAAAFAGLWLNERRWASRGVLWRPVGYGIAISMLWFDGSALAGRAMAEAIPTSVARTVALWLSPMLAGVVLVYAVHRLLAVHGVAASGRLGILALLTTTAIAMGAMWAPGVSAALLILIVGFAGGHRGLFGIGIAALLGYLVWFYYSLHTTLLVKSAMLTGTGLLLLAAWAAMRRLLDPPDVEHERA